MGWRRQDRQLRLGQRVDAMIKALDRLRLQPLAFQVLQMRFDQKNLAEALREFF
ncbi:hypothetical protein [Candidatus Accumulibacter vicinus]|uniref:Uncharacterized protein n=1 Tax=Candidatus Accumulibacter vicinus TaxID=2954382 RepID=A0A084XWZ8_9PROT|nr:hypothetical protein [Candidatus Accumulibacter vicinus]KFB66992.1 MAG: hypothetical protein CAPSK01_003933 [Candidatus Accumulibacter vicinus]